MQATCTTQEDAPSSVGLVIRRRTPQPPPTTSSSAAAERRVGPILAALGSRPPWSESARNRPRGAFGPAGAAAGGAPACSAATGSEPACRVAIIGLGRQGSTICAEQPAGAPPFGIAGACHASEKLRLVAGCDLLLEKRAAFTELWGCQSTYADFTEMIEQEKPDLVAICTAACLPKPAAFCPSELLASKPDAHADLCIAVAELGVPLVFCEKAIASSMTACDRVKAAFREHGTRLATGQFRRFDNRFMACAAAIASGEVGPPAAAIFFGSSSLLHGHIHTIDTISFLLGDPGIARVRGELTDRPDGSGGASSARLSTPLGMAPDQACLDRDPMSTYQIEFKNGAVATSVPSSGGATYEFEVVGPAGTLRTWYQLAADVVDDGPSGLAVAGASLRRHGAFSRPGGNFAFPSRGKTNLRSGDTTSGRDDGDYVWQHAEGRWAGVKLQSATVAALEDLVDGECMMTIHCHCDDSIKP